MIKLNNISKSYQTDTMETQALRNIDIEIQQGEFVSIMGPSGCGKSSLLNIIGLLDEPSEGQVLFDGEEIQFKRDKELAQVRNQKIGFIFQSFHLINDLKVVDNVELPLLYRKIKASERRRMALEILDKVGLSARSSHFPSQLSGGQQQRVAVARALVGQPSLLLADEPTGNLDSQMGNEVMTILENLNSDDNTTIVMVTHDKILAERTPRIIRIFDGQLVH